MGERQDGRAPGESQLRSLPASEIRLRCSGKDYVGAILNRRFLRLRCTEKDCKRGGFRVYHIWDVLTGKHVANDLVDGEGVTHREIVQEVVSDGYDSRGEHPPRTQ